MAVNEDLTVDVGIVKIHLPDVNYPGFLIMKSLAEEFGLETNSDAEEKLRTTLKTIQKDTYKKVKIDSESGFVFIDANSKQGDSILEVAIIINQLAIPPYRQELNSEHIEEVRKTLTTWKRPKPQKWNEGDIFSIPLCDGSFGYAQVLWHQNKKSSVTCAIFSYRGNEMMPIDTIVQSPVISALTVKNLFDLNSGKWKVEGTHSLVLEKLNVPWEHSGATGVGSKVYQEQTLTELLEAYFALKPWNAWHTDKFYDSFLLPGVNRPTKAIVLTREQKNEYRTSLGYNPKY